MKEYPTPVFVEECPPNCAHWKVSTDDQEFMSIELVTTNHPSNSLPSRMDYIEWGNDKMVIGKDLEKQFGQSLTAPDTDSFQNLVFLRDALSLFIARVQNGGHIPNN